MIAGLAAIALLAGAPQAAPAADFTPADLGRAAIYAGLCSTIGWDSSQDRVVEQAQAYAARHPEQSDEQLKAATAAGVEAGKAEIEAIMTALQSSGDVDAFKASLRGHCDRVVREMPSFLSRLPDTDAQFEAKITALLAGG